MNETRDLIIGIDLRNDSSQLCYYDRNADEPRSLPVKVHGYKLVLETFRSRFKV